MAPIKLRFGITDAARMQPCVLGIYVADKACVKGLPWWRTFAPPGGVSPLDRLDADKHTTLIYACWCREPAPTYA